MKKRFIPVAAPVFAGNEKKYVDDCLDSTWISSVGKYIQLFEQELARSCGVKHAISCSNGTVALHLSLLALGIGPGDEVIVPTFTYVASANCILYVGATPVFVDCEPERLFLKDLFRTRITRITRSFTEKSLKKRPFSVFSVKSVYRKKATRT